MICCGLPSISGLARPIGAAHPPRAAARGGHQVRRPARPRARPAPRRSRPAPGASPGWATHGRRQAAAGPGRRDARPTRPRHRSGGAAQQGRRGVVEQQRGELVQARRRRRTPSPARLGARQRPRAELVLVPVHPPVQLDVRQARAVDEHDVEHGVRGAAVGSPTERRRGSVAAAPGRRVLPVRRCRARIAWPDRRAARAPAAGP